MKIEKLAIKLLSKGIQGNASDVFILPSKNEYQISYRYHDQKVFVQKLMVEEAEKLILFFKYRGEMDVGERRRSQIGATDFLIENVVYRLRLSSVGDFRQRESLVIRFLHLFANNQKLNYFLKNQINEIRGKVYTKGLYLFCGAVGSGKTTTMYQIAKERKAAQVITIEDPVEIEETSFLQLQTNDKIFTNYEELIKTCLRHRPDILIVGEIRDTQTAKAVIRAALSGQTVFSTLHVRNKGGVINRLRELGVPVIEIEECLRGVIYQKILPATILSKNRNEYGVLFDYIFYSESKIKKAANFLEEDWKNHLKKVWAYGFISKAVFEKEKIL